MKRTTILVSLLFAAALALPVVAATAVTMAQSAGADGSWLRLPFRLVCHGIEERCLLVGGVPMPICARCTALYAGGLAGIALCAGIGPLRRRLMPTWILALAVLPLALDGTTQAAGLRLSTNGLRVATGLLAGCAFLIWVMQRVDRTEELPAESRGRPAAAP